MSEDKSVAVIGGGPIGSLQAIFLAKRGYKVNIYEYRADQRSIKEHSGRSRHLNLALNVRGIAALKAVGCDEDILALSVPMYGRMLHTADNRIFTTLYSSKHQAVFSIDRFSLSQHLLNVADSNPNIEIFFEHKLIQADFKNQTLVIQSAEKEVKHVCAGFTFGCDGAYSTVRQEMALQERLNYQQEYTDYGYKELTIPPTSDGEYAMPSNYFHIWPREQFMLTALPNIDKSFTVTLYLSFDIFNNIKTGEDLINFFAKHFPDLVGKIDTNDLIKEYLDNPISTFMSIKCCPHYLGSYALIMGDAAHTNVPFYGQQMNVGMEDCLIFDELFTLERDSFLSLHKTARLYSDKRWRDTHAIADLSMHSYTEMKLHSDSIWCSYITSWMHRLSPNTLSSMVLFSRTPYCEALEISKRRISNIKIGIKLTSLCFAALGIYFTFRHFKMIMI
jgi:kynurenine 3-monooxygenase